MTLTINGSNVSPLGAIVLVLVALQAAKGVLELATAVLERRNQRRVAQLRKERAEELRRQRDVEELRRQAGPAATSSRDASRDDPRINVRGPFRTGTIRPIVKPS